MIRRTMSEVDVKAGLQEIIKRIDEVYAQRPMTIKGPKPMLVTVSKTKPIEMIVEAYSIGQRHFGENYLKELLEKSQHPDVLRLCPDIKWHFIGHLQNNKVNKFRRIPNLYMLQTVDTEKLANNLNSAWEKLRDELKEPLRVLIQVNTSEEEAKNGISPSAAPTLYKHIRQNLKNLKLMGVMTIGAFGHDYATGPNPDFIALMNVQRAICKENSLEPDAVRVSMGMSDDFDKAIEMGSSIVRIGSSIFGHRAKKSA